MSATPDTDFNLKAIAARIDRDIAEAGKLNEETRKFVAEQHKLMAEGGKLMAEERKFDRERGVQTLLALTGLVGGLITVVRLIWPGRVP